MYHSKRATCKIVILARIRQLASPNVCVRRVLKALRLGFDFRTDRSKKLNEYGSKPTSDFILSGSNEA